MYLLKPTIKTIVRFSKHAVFESLVDYVLGLRFSKLIIFVNKI